MKPTFMTRRVCWLVTAIVWGSLALLMLVRLDAPAHAADCTEIPYSSVWNNDVHADYGSHEWTFDGTTVGYAGNEDDTIWNTPGCVASHKPYSH